MDHHLLGQSCALLAALTWGVALVLLKLCGEKIEPLALNLFKNVVGIVLLALTIAAVAILPIEGDPSLLAWDHIGDICILMLSGVIGIAVADTICFYALNLLGVGLLSIVDCLYSPFIILFSCLLLFEELAWCHYLGGALILVGVFISSRHPAPPGRTRGQLLLGILLGVVALAAMAIGIVIVKPILEDYDMLWATQIRLLGGTGFLALVTFILPGGRKLWLVFKPASVWKVSIPAAVLAAYLAMIFWVAGFKYTHASVAAILNQTSIVFSLILATLILKERFTARKFVAVVLAVPGVVLITLTSFFEPYLQKVAGLLT